MRRRRWWRRRARLLGEALGLSIALQLAGLERAHRAEHARRVRRALTRTRP